MAREVQNLMKAQLFKLGFFSVLISQYGTPSTTEVEVDNG